MPTVSIYDQKKNEVGQIELADGVFGVPVRKEILHMAVKAHLAAKRAGTHKVKTRSEVSGGGRKPWRQKGTGRARAGSSRSPIWRGGAVVHGPSPRDYTLKVNRKVKLLALKMALSSQVLADKLLVVDRVELPEIKTKHFSEIAKAFDLKKALIVLDNSDNTFELSARNYPGVKVIRQDMLNVYDILVHEQLVMLKDAAKMVEERLI